MAPTTFSLSLSPRIGNVGAQCIALHVGNPRQEGSTLVEITEPRARLDERDELLRKSRNASFGRHYSFPEMTRRCHPVPTARPTERDSSQLLRRLTNHRLRIVELLEVLECDAELAGGAKSSTRSDDGVGDSHGFIWSQRSARNEISVPDIRSANSAVLASGVVTSTLPCAPFPASFRKPPEAR